MLLLMSITRMTRSPVALSLGPSQLLAPHLYPGIPNDNLQSKRQISVQISAFGAELMALKAGVEEATTHLWASWHLAIWVISMSVVLNATNVTLEAAWTKRESHCHTILFESTSQAQSVISISKIIDTKDTYAYPFTKTLTNPEFHGFRMLLCN
jgi:hypothetical protein